MKILGRKSRDTPVDPWTETAEGGAGSESSTTNQDHSEPPPQAPLTRRGAAQPRQPYGANLEDEHIEFIKHVRSQRKWILHWAMWVTALLLASTGIIIWYYLQKLGDKADSKVLLTWITSVIAACIAIIASIAKFLFAETMKDIRPMQNDSPKDK